MSHPSDDESYIDLIRRAAKVRHFLAKNPDSTFNEIKNAIFPDNAPLKWLMNRGYVRRMKQVNDPKSPWFGSPPRYECVPMGIFFEHDEDDSEGIEASAKEMGEGREDDI